MISIGCMSCITCAASSMLSLAHRFCPSAPLVNLDDLMTYLCFTLFLCSRLKCHLHRSWKIWIYLGSKKFFLVSLWTKLWTPRESNTFSNQGASVLKTIYSLLLDAKRYVAVVENYVCRCRFVWIFMFRWWCMFGYNTLSLSIYVASDV
jgi:hypothetical protein